MCTIKFFTRLSIVLVLFFSSACGAVKTPTASQESPDTTPTPEPSATPLPPTATLEPTPTATLEPTSTATLVPTATLLPSATLPPAPTLVPGLVFEVTTEGATLQLTTHLCNLQSIGYGTFTTSGAADDWESMMDITSTIIERGQTIVPAPGDDVMCYFTGRFIRGGATASQLQAWVDGDKVYLIDQAGNQSDLIFAGTNAQAQILLLFSAPSYEYAPIQLQMTDILVDLP